MARKRRLSAASGSSAPVSAPQQEVSIEGLLGLLQGLFKPRKTNERIKPNRNSVV